jgi:deoxyribodipyrimidine photo-lyase
MKAVTLAWFRQDLRLQDQPMLVEALRLGQPLVPVYIHAPAEAGDWPPGGASAWWLDHALHSLQAELRLLGLPLVTRQGPSLSALQEIIRELASAGLTVSTVLFSRLYEPAAAARDAHVRQALQDQGIEVQVFNASLLIEPEQVRNKSGQPFRVFTPFWKHLRTLPLQPPVHTRISDLFAPANVARSEPLDSLGLLPAIAWDKAFPQHWDPTLMGAAKLLHAFVSDRVSAYREQRNVPGVEGTSRLSPYLHWGQLSPRQVWAAVHAAGEQDGGGGDTFLSEVAWREFAYHLLHHVPDSPEHAMKPAFRTFPWQPDPAQLLAWQQGQTGYPLVTPVCASCGKPAGCITGYGWW